MKLDLVQRWMLANQYQILEYLAKLQNDDHLAKDYAAAHEAIAQGYEQEYTQLTQHIMDDPLSQKECEEVVNIMAMFRAIQQTYSKLTDKTGVDEFNTKFEGFDGNEDPRQMSYASYFCETHRRFDEFKGISFNSHSPASLIRYRRMLSEWFRSDNKYILTKDDVIRITNAANAG